MSNDKIITGIDIGSNTIKVVVSDMQSSSNPAILGVGTANSTGMRNGYIVDLPQVVQSVSKALDGAVRNARIRPTHAYLSIGGLSLSGHISTGSTHIRHSDSIITEHDLHNVAQNATYNAEPDLLNKKTMHDIPISYNIDGAKALCHPMGMRATRLGTTVMLINALESHIDDFVSAVEDAGVEVVDVTAAPLAASFASVSTAEKMQGCVMLDIGAQSTDIIVFDDNMPIALKVIPHGSDDVTNALALELKLPTTEAEQIKKGGVIDSKINQNKIDKIITKSLSKLFTEVKDVLKELGGDTLLPAGVLITGGGSRLANIENITKETLKLPAKIVYSNASKIAGNPEYSVAYGLCIWGANNESDSGAITTLKNGFKKIGGWLKKLTP